MHFTILLLAIVATVLALVRFNIIIQINARTNVPPHSHNLFPNSTPTVLNSTSSHNGQVIQSNHNTTVSGAGADHSLQRQRQRQQPQQFPFHFPPLSQLPSPCH